jgi:hypothetical protein
MQCLTHDGKHLLITKFRTNDPLDPLDPQLLSYTVRVYMCASCSHLARAQHLEGRLVIIECPAHDGKHLSSSIPLLDVGQQGGLSIGY